MWFSHVRTLLRRAKRFLLQRRLDRDVRAEMEEHLRHQTDAYIASGLSRADAARLAALEIGAIDAWREACRDTWRVSFLQDALRDAAMACRVWRREWAIAATVVVTLAIGVGANLAVFALLNTLMFLPPASAREPDRLVSVQEPISYRRLLELRQHLRQLDLVAYTRVWLTLTASDEPKSVPAECVTPSYFRVLGVPAALGRVFRDAESSQDDAMGVVVSHGFWQRELGGSPSAIGASVSIGHVPFHVVGVAPRGFTGVEPATTDLWVLVTDAPTQCSFTGESLLQSSGGGWLNLVGRLADGVTREQAEAELAAAATPDEIFQRAMERRRSDRLVSLQASRRFGTQRDVSIATWLFGGAIAVLLIACANIAGLLSIRAFDKQHEIAVRLQLGATRRRVMSQVAVEQMVLSIAAALAALGVAYGLGVILRKFFAYGELFTRIEPAWMVSAVAIALLSGLVAGAWPALQVSRVNATSLRRSRRLGGTTRSWLRSGLLVTQVALALSLSIGAGLFVRSVQESRRGLGYDPDGLAVAAIDLRKFGYRDGQETEDALDQVAQRLARLPDVEGVSLSTGFFLGVGGPAAVTPERVMVSAVSPGYFRLIGTRLVSGREFDATDDVRAPRVAVIDSDVAKRRWPDRSAVGQCVVGAGSECVTVVGVSEARRTSIGTVASQMEMFVPLSQRGAGTSPSLILLRVNPSVSLSRAEIARTIRESLPRLPAVSVKSFDELADVQTRSWRLGRLLFGVFGLFAVVLSAIGLYASLAFGVRQRRAEIGLRMALGSQRWEVVGLIARHAMRLVLAGLMVGGAMGVTGARYMRALLFHDSRSDVTVYVAAVAVVTVAAAAGCLVPAIRAARISPMAALRED
jgi:predicted permease